MSSSQDCFFSEQEETVIKKLFTGKSDQEINKYYIKVSETIFYKEILRQHLDRIKNPLYQQQNEIKILNEVIDRIQENYSDDETENEIKKERRQIVLINKSLNDIYEKETSKKLRFCQDTKKKDGNQKKPKKIQKIKEETKEEINEQKQEEIKEETKQDIKEQKREENKKKLQGLALNQKTILKNSVKNDEIIDENNEELDRHQQLPRFLRDGNELISKQIKQFQFEFEGFQDILRDKTQDRLQLTTLIGDYLTASEKINRLLFGHRTMIHSYFESSGNKFQSFSGVLKDF